MCMGIPGRVTAVDSESVEVTIAGRTRRLSALLVPDLAVGDEVLVAGGLVLERLPADEAATRQELFAALLEAVQDLGPSD